MSQLHKLTSLVKKRKRVGRGGSRGGTSGRGHKGQLGRSGGGVRIGFEGGQTPLIRRIPKHGFNNVRHQKNIEIVLISTLEKKFNQGDIITPDQLVSNGIIKPKKGEPFSVKILSSGKNLTKKFTVQANAFSKGAVQEIERAGGKVEVLN